MNRLQCITHTIQVGQSKLSETVYFTISGASGHVKVVEQGCPVEYSGKTLPQAIAKMLQCRHFNGVPVTGVRGLTR